MKDEELTQVHHVAINVSNLAAAIKWYQTSFNCRLIHQEPRQAILQFANVKLALLLPSQEQPHVAFVKADAANFGELFPQPGDIQSTCLADPTGNLVELVAT